MRYKKHLLYLGGVILLLLVIAYPVLQFDNQTQSDDQNRTYSSRGNVTDSKNSGELEYEYGLSYNGTPRGLNGYVVPSQWFKNIFFDTNLNLTLPKGNTESDLDGIYASDFNNDAFTDFLAVFEGNPYLFKNTDGEFDYLGSLNKLGSQIEAAHFFDYNNDGWEDLYLLSNNKSVFLWNDNGNFVKRSVGLSYGYDAVRGAATADYNNDGCLDVFIFQANNWETSRPAGYNSRISIKKDNGNPNRLFKGNCNRFSEVTKKAGIKGSAWSLTGSFADLTNDSYPDIHVANDFNNDVLYINGGNGTFERRILPNFTDRNGMSSEIADVNDDGLLDIFVTNIYYKGRSYYYGGRIKGNNLLINQGNGSFVNSAKKYGVRKGGWGWAAEFQDFNNDRYLDLYQAETSGPSSKRNYPIFWRGTQKPKFKQINSSSVGFGGSAPVGVVSTDYNLDGNPDILVSNYANYKHRDLVDIYKNIADGNNSIYVTLRNGNYTSIGTKVVVMGDKYRETKLKTSETDYMSQSSRALHFGLGNVTEVNITVHWSDSSMTFLKNISSGVRIAVNKNGIYKKYKLKD